MASSSPIRNAGPHALTTPHLHLAGDVCPLCEQPIPHDRFDEISERIEAREQNRALEIATKVQNELAAGKAQILEEARAESEQKIVAAREEARLAAEASASEQLAAAKQAGREAQAALQSKVEQAEAATEQAKQEAAANEAHIRAEAARTAEAAVQGKLAEVEQARVDSETALQDRIEQAEAAKVAAEVAGSTLQAQLTEAQRKSEATIEKLKQDAAFRESEIRREAAAAAETSAQEKIAGIEQARADAETKAATATEQLNALQSTHENQLAERLREQREALENDKTAAVNAEKSAAFKETLKLSTKLDELQRALDKKTAEELGEGAEIDLFESLKAEFEGDRIERVNKGQPGADILHTVIHNGKECGKIIYDSKNHCAWRNDFVTKLAADQMAAKAEHAILSTRKFPAGVQHLCVQDGVVVASPSRVVALVQIVRQHLVQTHTLRMSNEARLEKTAQLYSFITSERCADLLARIDTHADDLLDIQVKEKKAHDATWKRQGELIRSVQKVRAELCNEIDGIIGTADAERAQ